MERCCPFCHKFFVPSRSHPKQMVCCQPVCQRQRRAQYSKHKLEKDPEYRQVCRDSARKWRTCHPDYWRPYRANHPDSVERNRALQKCRDLRCRLSHLANNTLAPGVSSFAATVWWPGPPGNLANNNFAPAHLIVLPQLTSFPPTSPRLANNNSMARQPLLPDTPLQNADSPLFPSHLP